MKLYGTRSRICRFPNVFPSFLHIFMSCYMLLHDCQCFSMFFNVFTFSCVCICFHFRFVDSRSFNEFLKVSQCFNTTKNDRNDIHDRFGDRTSSSLFTGKSQNLNLHVDTLKVCKCCNCDKQSSLLSLAPSDHLVLKLFGKSLTQSQSPHHTAICMRFIRRI